MIFYDYFCILEFLVLNFIVNLLSVNELQL